MSTSYYQSTQLSTAATFVTPEDFKTYTGIDLDESLNDDITTPDRFMRDAEDEIINYVNMQSWRPISRNLAQNKYTQSQVFSLKKAIILQAEYMFYNGDMLKNNGVDPDRGEVVRNETLKKVSISPKASDELKQSGILTLVMRRRW